LTNSAMGMGSRTPSREWLEEAAPGKNHAGRAPGAATAAVPSTYNRT